MMPPATLRLDCMGTKGLDPGCSGTLTNGLYCCSHPESRKLRTLCGFLCGHRSCTKNFVIMPAQTTLLKGTVGIEPRITQDFTQARTQHHPALQTSKVRAWIAQ